VRLMRPCGPTRSGAPPLACGTRCGPGGGRAGRVVGPRARGGAGERPSAQLRPPPRVAHHRGRHRRLTRIRARGTAGGGLVQGAGVICSRVGRRGRVVWGRQFKGDDAIERALWPAAGAGPGGSRRAPRAADQSAGAARAPGAARRRPPSPSPPPPTLPLRPCTARRRPAEAVTQMRAAGAAAGGRGGGRRRQARGAAQPSAGRRRAGRRAAAGHAHMRRRLPARQQVGGRAAPEYWIQGMQTAGNRARPLTPMVVLRALARPRGGGAAGSRARRLTGGRRRRWLTKERAPGCQPRVRWVVGNAGG
jgi:hypothetical protein